MCGEQSLGRVFTISASGSPPRVRGTESSPGLPVLDRWITPACAGNSHPGSRLAFPAADHPRVCGEQAEHSAVLLSDVGSPPRVRGTGCVPVIVALPVGITPACAGNSRCCWPVCCCSWDHPRVCGEQRVSPYVPASSRGSPPRVRGTDTQNSQKLYTNGITPACAGNRPYPVRLPFPHRDHPRVCGEQNSRPAKC